ncbi:L-glutaminase [Kribbella voronezhensis]|uniref:Glutaminase n=1 Tax=Kribbella voronezhensis TaxID=2512212 RepID=A0A4R7SWL8_9ACTN|nr:glutaminase A [Kribbella voronezhensis]TDU83335.1 L-glutaminase [Kribbella voronezhensis]
MANPDRYVSTGGLPEVTTVAELVQTAYKTFRDVGEGAVSDVYPALSRVDPDRFGVCIGAIDGRMIEAGDCRRPFTIMSVAKPFVFALVCQAVGIDAVRELVGVNATGLSFNSVRAVEQSRAGRTNPMVNPGAIAVTSLTPGRSLEDRWRFLLDGLSRFAGHDLLLDAEVLASALATNHRNRALAALLKSVGALAGDPEQATELYTRQSCLKVAATDLAVMGATLADGGVCPATQERVVDPDVARVTLAVMTIAGLYETSGDWLLDVGVPGKSGIGGGIVAVSPGKGAIGLFAPRLDQAGNSVQGQLAARFLSRRLGLDLLASQPVPPAAGQS